MWSNENMVGEEMSKMHTEILAVIILDTSSQDWKLGRMDGSR